jgi:endonuclease/exonuclease/phosphatase family metal-dependent hydrolase
MLGCFQHLLPPEKFWFIGYLSIAFPYLIVVVFCFMLFWFFAKRHRSYFLISAIPLAIGFQQIGVLFSLRHHDFVLEKNENDVRLLTWNIMGFNGFKPGVKERELNADRIFNTLNEYKPDIICFQEYGQFENLNLGRSYLAQMEKLGYTYHVLSRDYSRVTYSYSSGVAIFSKYKIINKEKISYRSSPESLLFADVVVGKDTFRIFTTHLQSYRFSSQELEQFEKLKDNERPEIQKSKSLFTKMQRAFRNRGAQVDQALPVIEKSPYLQIIGLDMNDVPTSYAYWEIRKDRKDAFLEKGFGIGRSFNSVLPTLRIDYIFTHPLIEVTQMVTLNRPYSDHLPVIADLRLQK